jgi:hypothetical protein
VRSSVRGIQPMICGAGEGTVDIDVPISSDAVCGVDVVDGCMIKRRWFCKQGSDGVREWLVCYKFKERS